MSRICGVRSVLVDAGSLKDGEVVLGLLTAVKVGDVEAMIPKDDQAFVTPSQAR